MTILERPLYGRIAIETSPWASSFSWTDRTSTLVDGIRYSEGGRIGTPGTSQVDVGTLTATFKDAATVPVVGDLVRLKRYGTSEYFWVGYVQDVSQRIVFGNRSSNTAPFVMTTIYCNDWVGYISQFQAVGAGSVNTTTGAVENYSTYYWQNRVAALNKIVDSAFATKIITAQSGTPTTPPMGDIDLVGTLAQHLDLITTSNNVVWFGTHTLPSNKTTGRTDLIKVNFLSNLTSSGKTFTDAVGTSGQLHYTEIDFENTTQNVVNSVIINNRARFQPDNVDLTRIGGYNESNYMVVNNTNVVGTVVDKSWVATDSTSITNYGIRQATFDTNVTITDGGSYSPIGNLISNPSVEYDDNGHSADSGTVYRRRKPSEESSPFSAYVGDWAMRMRIKTAAPTPTVLFSGGESDGIPVHPKAFNGYYFYARAARGATSRTDARARARIKWYDADEATISTDYGSYVSLTTTNTWYQVSVLNDVAPSGAVRATVGIEYSRSGGGNYSVGDVLWSDAFSMNLLNTTSTYFDGDTPWDADYAYFWTGGVGSSPSYRVNNYLDDAATAILARYNTTSLVVSRIRWNAQEDLTAVSSLIVGSTISLVYKSTTTTYRIVGIDGTVDPDRYMIDYYLAKV